MGTRDETRAGKLFFFSFLLISLAIIYRQYTATHTPSPSLTPDEWGLETRREPVSFLFAHFTNYYLQTSMRASGLVAVNPHKYILSIADSILQKNMQQSTY
jgi:hypothetical protein